MMRKGTLSDAIEVVSTMDIVESFAVPYKKRNGKTYLLCPGHDDKHFGSCYIDKNDNGYYCYACGEHVQKWDMVLKLNGNKKSEAAEWFFRTAGMSPVAENKEDPYKKAVRLVRKLEAYLKNDVIYNDVKVCDKIDSSYGRNINGEYLYSELAITNPLVDIYKNNKQTFKDLVSQMLDSKIKKIARTKHNYEKHADDGIYIDDIGLIPYGEMVENCQIIMNDIQELLNEVINL